MIPHFFGKYILLFICFHGSVSLSMNIKIKTSFFDKKCELIRVDACKGLLYNYTIFPNHMGHSHQEEAEMEINQFLPLTKINCSPSLKLFLCSLYFPVCTIMTNPLQPCKSLCIQNRHGCEPLINRFNFKWPENMNCDLFPENQLCLRENKTGATLNPNGAGPLYTNPSSAGLNNRALQLAPFGSTGRQSGTPSRPAQFICPAPLQVPSRYSYRVRLGASHIEENCGIPCHQHFFTGTQSRRFARLWICLWSFLCLASTLFTVLTFFVDMKRFQYPERPIIFLTACYFMVSLTYVLGFFLGDRFACTGPFPTPDKTRLPQAEMPRLISQGTKSEGCILLFMLLYFFSMASHIWWVILTVTWYLAAKCHWAHEAIARNAQYFHLAAWALPAAQTIGVLTWGQVDGDPISGVCFTGLANPHALRLFIIAPLCLYLAVGTAFLIAGCVSMFKIRTIIKTEGTVKTDKLEKLIIRIGMFSVLYIMPALVVIGCHFHESQRHAVWSLSWYSELCRRQRRYMHTACAAHERRLAASGGTAGLQKPEFELFMIRYLMSLVVGITSGIWIWTGKTLLSWRRFFLRVCFCCGCGGSKRVDTTAAGSTGAGSVGLATIPLDSSRIAVATSSAAASLPSWSNRYHAGLVTPTESQPMVCWSSSHTASISRHDTSAVNAV